MTKLYKMAPKMTKDQAAIIEKMIEDGCTTKYVAEVINKSQRTVQRYIQEHISEVEGEPWLPFEGISLGRASKGPAREEAVLSILEHDETLTYNQVIDRLPEDLKCCRTTLRKTYKGLDITRKRLRKRPYERNDPETIKMRKIYAREVSRIPDEKLFFFLMNSASICILALSSAMHIKVSSQQSINLATRAKIFR